MYSREWSPFVRRDRKERARPKLARETNNRAAKSGESDADGEGAADAEQEEQGGSIVNQKILALILIQTRKGIPAGEGVKARCRHVGIFGINVVVRARGRLEMEGLL